MPETPKSWENTFMTAKKICVLLCFQSFLCANHFNFNEGYFYSRSFQKYSRTSEENSKTFQAYPTIFRYQGLFKARVNHALGDEHLGKTDTRSGPCLHYSPYFTFYKTDISLIHTVSPSYPKGVCLKADLDRPYNFCLWLLCTTSIHHYFQPSTRTQFSLTSSTGVVCLIYTTQSVMKSWCKLDVHNSHKQKIVPSKSAFREGWQ